MSVVASQSSPNNSSSARLGQLHRIVVTTAPNHDANVYTVNRREQRDDAPATIDTVVVNRCSFSRSSVAQTSVVVAERRRAAFALAAAAANSGSTFRILIDNIIDERN